MSLIKKAKNMADLYKRSPMAALARVADILGIDIKPYIDARLKDRTKILGLDPSTLTTSELSRFMNAISNTTTAKPKTLTIDEFLLSPRIRDYVSQQNADRLGNLFRDNGSDKATTHDYYRVYQPILDSALKNQESVSLAEIGIGTNNIDVLSNMGALGTPGASLRSFRDYSRLIKVFGGDIDTRVLFSEDRIHTQRVDQLDPSTIKAFILESNPTILIDDGLHALRPNINVLIEYISRIRTETQSASDSWLAIEDIGINSDREECWLAILDTIQFLAHTWLIRTQNSLMVIIKARSS